MTTAVIKGLRHANIPYQVAPYEADAQLAHLYMVKHIDAALTLDSDLVTYGVKKVIFPCEKSRTHNFRRVKWEYSTLTLVSRHQL